MADTPLTPTPAQPIFFVHVMKTGGATVSWRFRRLLPVDAVYPTKGIDENMYGATQNLALLRSLPAERRSAIAFYTGHFPLYAADWITGCRTVTVFREPVARTLSLLRMRARSDHYRGKGLEEIYQRRSVFERDIHNHQTKVLGLLHSNGQLSVLNGFTAERRQLDLAIEALDTIDAFGVTDRLAGFLADLAVLTGLPVDAGVDVHVSDGTPEPTPALLDRIREDNALDIELYAEVRRRLGDRTSAGRAVPADLATTAGTARGEDTDSFGNQDRPGAV